MKMDLYLEKDSQFLTLHHQWNSIPLCSFYANVETLIRQMFRVKINLAFFQSEAIFVQLDKLDELDRITQT